MAPEDPKPHIHVDDDWKKQAQAEKERLDREVGQGRPAAPGAPGVGAGAAAAGLGGMPGAGVAPGLGAAAAPGVASGEASGEERLPPATFATLVQTLATQAAIFMSEQRDPETGAIVRNLDLAKHNIDLLRMLEEKTKGNLADDERRLLESVLYELLMAYVAAAS
jgi:hypothetical protein